MDVKKSTQTWIRLAEIIEDRIATATDADLASFQLELENLVADHKEIVDGLVMMVRSIKKMRAARKKRVRSVFKRSKKK